MRGRVVKRATCFACRCRPAEIRLPRTILAGACRGREILAPPTKKLGADRRRLLRRILAPTVGNPVTPHPRRENRHTQLRCGPRKVPLRRPPVPRNAGEIPS